MKKTFRSESGGRLDVILTELTGYTRSYIKQLVEKDAVRVNDEEVKKSGQIVKPADEITLDEPELVTKIEKKDIPVEILYEDDDIAVINKPQGLTVHPAGGNYTDTLVNALMYRLDNLSGINGEIRPGIVHRLDKDTSGVMVVAKTDAAHLALSEQIAARTVKKEYVAILEGTPANGEGTIITKIGRNPKDRKLMAVTSDGREAVTDYKVVTRFKENSFVLFRIRTGRTHQIRVHAKYIGHPVVGDKSYGHKKQKFDLNGQLLHSYRLTIVHPTSGKVITFTAPLPDYFEKVYNVLAAKDGLPPFDPSIVVNRD